VVLEAGRLDGERDLELAQIPGMLLVPGRDVHLGEDPELHRPPPWSVSSRCRTTIRFSDLSTGLSNATNSPDVSAPEAPRRGPPGPDRRLSPAHLRGGRAGVRGARLREREATGDLAPRG